MHPILRLPQNPDIIQGISEILSTGLPDVARARVKQIPVPGLVVTTSNGSNCKFLLTLYLTIYRTYLRIWTPSEQKYPASSAVKQVEDL